MLDLLIVLFPEIFVTVPFVDLTLKIESISEIKILFIDLNQDHSQDLHLRLKNLPILHVQFPLKFMITTMKFFEVEDKFEVNMFTIEMTNAITLTC